MQPPVMPEDGHTTRVTSGEDASSPAAGKDTSLLEALWDDEDTRAFYECLPDLRFVVARQSSNQVKRMVSVFTNTFYIKLNSGYLKYKICQLET